MTRPDHSETADARADIQRFLAANPHHELAPALRVLLQRTAPPTQAEAIPVMIAYANMAGEWPVRDDDVQIAEAAIATKGVKGPWAIAIWAQWKTLTYFMGGGT